MRCTLNVRLASIAIQLSRGPMGRYEVNQLLGAAPDVVRERHTQGGLGGDDAYQAYLYGHVLVEVASEQVDGRAVGGTADGVELVRFEPVE